MFEVFERCISTLIGVRGEIEFAALYISAISRSDHEGGVNIIILYRTGEIVRPTQLVRQKQAEADRQHCSKSVTIYDAFAALPGHGGKTDGRAAKSGDLVPVQLSARVSDEGNAPAPPVDDSAPKVHSI